MSSIWFLVLIEGVSMVAAVKAAPLNAKIIDFQVTTALPAVAGAP
jgi:hypothetical protein